MEKIDEVRKDKGEAIIKNKCEQSLCEHLFTGAGLFHNSDGTVSDRWVLAYTIICVSLLIIFIWAFGKHPKPEYAFELLKLYVSIVLPLLIGGQTAENYFRRRKRGEDNEIED
jgi:hypothetical protein